jgi:hypothetical protein
MSDAAGSRRAIVLCALIALSGVIAPLMPGGATGLSAVAADIQAAGESGPAGLHFETWELADDSALPPTGVFVRPDPVVHLLNCDGVSQVAWSPSLPLRPPILPSYS